MKKLIFIFTLIILSSIEFSSYSQAYNSIRIADRSRTDYESSDGIEISITPYSDYYKVQLFNSNYNDRNDYTTYTFTWYLSYRGKRVSDYFTERMQCRRTTTRNVYAWPNSVPAGNQKYVTVQFGREPGQKDRRD